MPRKYMNESLSLISRRAVEHQFVSIRVPSGKDSRAWPNNVAKADIKLLKKVVVNK